MEKRDDGGQAFPVPGLPNLPNDQFMYPERGMSLRDYFAAKEMHAELVSAGSFTGPAKALATAARLAGQSIEQRVAANAYGMSDAMLAERAK